MTEDQTIRAALAILESRIIAREAKIHSVGDIRNYLAIKFSGLKHEVFAMVFLDTRHNVIEFREMFAGTIDGASVYPREVVRAVMETNAAAIILAHNHPSGDPEPSEADRSITRKISQVMNLIDVRVLDHIVVSGPLSVSFAERGLI